MKYLVLSALASALLVGCNQNTATLPPADTSTEATTTAPAAPAVVAGAQAVSEASVVVSEVVAPQNGWIVIHQSNPDGSVKVPESIGHSPVAAGDNVDIPVALDTSVATGDKLWAMVHIDEGTIGTYEFPGADKPITEGDKPVMSSFDVQ